MVKIFRIGHRHFHNGVITIASEVDIKHNKIWYGASFCSPKEKTYFKEMGNDWALTNMKEKVENNNYIFMEDKFTHASILRAILEEMYDDIHTPRWALTLIAEQLKYPVGLHRYGSKKAKSQELLSIEVDSEYSKQQLILAFEYLHTLSDIDSDFIAVNQLIHTYLNPELIKVRT